MRAEGPNPFDPDTRVAPDSRADVAVVGGGPAGSAAALTLLRYSALRVVLIERSAYTSFRIGECLAPGALDLLRYLAAEEALTASCPIPAQGVSAAWGSSNLQVQDFLLAGRGTGWHLDRRRFDESLANLAAARGATVLLRSRLVDASRDPDGVWRLRVQAGSSREPVGFRARYLIDATGRRAVTARGQAAKLTAHDRLVGISGLYHFRRPVPQGGFTLVEAAPGGWWYTAPVKAEHVLAVFMTDADLVRQHGYHHSDGWLRNLASSIHTRRRLRGGQLRAPIRVHGAYSGTVQPTAGPGWIAAGDAAASFDPLASMGIGYALLSGIEAGRVAHNVLTGSGKLADAYAESVAAHFARYRELRGAYYGMERRWADQPFWSRRHTSQAEEAGPPRP